MTERRVVLVTGGSGLVGSGIKTVVEEEPRSNETWIFLSSKVKHYITCHLFLSASDVKEIIIQDPYTYLFSTGC